MTCAIAAAAAAELPAATSSSARALRQGRRRDGPASSQPPSSSQRPLGAQQATTSMAHTQGACHSSRCDPRCRPAGRACAASSASRRDLSGIDETAASDARPDAAACRRLERAARTPRRRRPPAPRPRPSQGSPGRAGRRGSALCTPGLRRVETARPRARQAGARPHGRSCRPAGPATTARSVTSWASRAKPAIACLCTSTMTRADRRQRADDTATGDAASAAAQRRACRQNVS